jgi:hypothetical protein
MRSISTLRHCTHVRFGAGCILAKRETDSGSIKDVWFAGDEKVRAILPAYLDDATVELTKEQRKSLRAAWSIYKKSQPKPLKRIELAFTKLTNKRNACSAAWYEGWDASLAAGEPEQNLEPEEEITEIGSESRPERENAA